MQLTSPQQSNGITPVSWRFVWIGLALLLATWPVAALSQGPMQGPGPMQVDPYAAPPQIDPLFGESIAGRSGQALGGVVRGGFVTGPGVGRENSFAPLEFMPYFFLEDGLIFGDFRGFRSVEDGFGANVGTGYRQYIRKWDRIIGANFYYDYDNTSGQLFRQVGFGLETMGPLWDMRANAYFPVTETRKELSLSDPFNLRFSGNNILFDQIRTFGVHLKGLDHEITVPLPGRMLERHNVKASAGWYHFQQERVDSTWGWKGRLEGDVISNVHLGLEVTNDNTFDTNVVFSVAVSYGGFREPEGQRPTQFSRMTEPVKRQYTAVVQKDPELESGLIALRDDGTPFFVEHVASETPYDRDNLVFMRQVAPQYDPAAVLGTFENPYLTIADAQDPNTTLSDITFVWTNSEYDNTTITTESGVRLLGEADNAPHTIVINGSTVLLPRAVNNPDPDPLDPFDPLRFDLKPLLTFSDRVTAVDAVTLTSRLALNDGTFRRTEFSGFRVGDELDQTSGSTGNGIIAGAGVTGVDVNFTEVNWAVADGIQLNGVGQMSFSGTRIFNSGDNGFHVNGGNPQITFAKAPGVELTFNQAPNLPDVRSEIENDAQIAPLGYGLLVENTAAGSLVELAPLNEQFFAELRSVGGGGVLIQNAAGAVGIGPVTVISSPVESIQIINNSGAFVFRDTVNIGDTTGVPNSGPLEDAINIQNLLFGGVTTFRGEVTINERQARGIDLGTEIGNAGNVNFLGGVIMANNVNNPANLPLAAAIEYQQSSGNVVFNNVDGGNAIELTGGNGEGILIGEFVQGETPGDLASNNTGDFRVLADATISEMRGVSLQILQDDSSITFDQNLTIEDRGNIGINIFQQRQPVRFNETTTVNGMLPNTPAAVAVNITGTPFLSFDPLFDPVTDAFPPPEELDGSVFFELLTINDAVAANAGLVSGLNVADVQAPVVLNELNIFSNSGIALLARQAGNAFGLDIADITGRQLNGFLSVDDGIIRADGSSAINAENSRLSLRFSEISSDNPVTEGIHMVRNALGGFRPTVFTLEVDAGTLVVPGQGGTIVDAGTQGVLFVNTGNLRLNGISIEDSGQEGILVSNFNDPIPLIVNGVQIDQGIIDDLLFTNIVRVDNSLIEDSGNHGLYTIDVPEVTLINDVFDDNGGPFEAEIRLQATRDLRNRDGELPNINISHVFRLTDTNVTETENSNAVEILARELIRLPGNLDVAGRDPNAIFVQRGGPTGTPSLDLALLGTNFNAPVITIEDIGPFPQNETFIDFFTGTSITIPDQRDAALLVDWDGPALINSVGYTYTSERDFSYGVRIEQENRNTLTTLDFTNNLFILGDPGVGIEGRNSEAFSGEIEGPADFVINDNVFFIDESADGATGILIDFNGVAAITLDGVQDDVNLDALIPDPLNDFGDDFIEYAIGQVGTNPPNLVTVEGPFGNIILMHANFTQAIDLRFNDAGQATIDNNVIANEPGVIDIGQQGIRIENRVSLQLFGSLNNGVLLDDDGRFGNAGDQNVTDSIAPWFEIIGPGTVDGTIQINGNQAP